MIGNLTSYDIKFPLALLDSSPVKQYFTPIASTILLSIKLWEAPVSRRAVVGNLEFPTCSSRGKKRYEAADSEEG